MSGFKEALCLAGQMFFVKNLKKFLVKFNEFLKSFEIMLIYKVFRVLGKNSFNLLHF